MLGVIKPSVSAAEKRRQQGRGEDPLPPIITGNEKEKLNCRNCIGCGFIYTLEEYERRDHCGFCQRPLTSDNRKENRRRRDEGEDVASLAKAEALKNRLVSHDRESAARTKVTDDDQA